MAVFTRFGLNRSVTFEVKFLWEKKGDLICFVLMSMKLDEKNNIPQHLRKRFVLYHDNSLFSWEDKLKHWKLFNILASCQLFQKLKCNVNWHFLSLWILVLYHLFVFFFTLCNHLHPNVLYCFAWDEMFRIKKVTNLCVP